MFADTDFAANRKIDGLDEYRREKLSLLKANLEVAKDSRDKLESLVRLSYKSFKLLRTIAKEDAVAVVDPQEMVTKFRFDIHQHTFNFYTPHT